MKALSAAVMLGLTITAAPAFADDGSTSPWSIDLAVVSDYVFRGVSQSDEDPTLQAGIRYTHDSGWYIGTWGSGVDFGDAIGADAEIDGFIGYAWALNNDWGADIQLIRYFYPGTNSGIDLDYNELIGVLTYKDNLNFTLGWSNDVFNLSEDGLFLGVAGSVPLPQEFSLDLGGGYYGFGDDAFTGNDDNYMYWSVGVSRSFGPIDASLTYYDTNENAEHIFGEKIADQRVALSLGVSF